MQHNRHTKITFVKCDYCNQLAQLVKGDVIYPHRPDLYALNFWYCEPCGAYVGCHKYNEKQGRDGFQPLGRLANAELRAAKTKAHTLFDPLWKNKHFKSRRKAYAWLANNMQLPIEKTHIGMFTVAQCDQVIEICKKYKQSERFKNEDLRNVRADTRSLDKWENL